MKKQKGITLIALIITIIVMLILVGVTVTTAINGGLFEKARIAAKGTQKEVDKEKLSMALALAYTETAGKIDTDKLKNELGDEWTVIGTGPYLCENTKTGSKFTVKADGEITDEDLLIINCKIVETNLEGETGKGIFFIPQSGFDYQKEFCEFAKKTTGQQTITSVEDGWKKIAEQEELTPEEMVKAINSNWGLTGENELTIDEWTRLHALMNKMENKQATIKFNGKNVGDDEAPAFATAFESEDTKLERTPIKVTVTVTENGEEKVKTWSINNPIDVIKPGDIFLQEDKSDSKKDTYYTVLYNDDSHGLQLIANKTYDYNPYPFYFSEYAFELLTYMNNAAAKEVNISKYAEKTRNVGGPFIDTAEDKSDNWPADEYYLEDCNQMKNLGIIKMEKQPNDTNPFFSGNSYILSSRIVIKDGEKTIYGLRMVSAAGEYGDNVYKEIPTHSPTFGGISIELPLRPVVKISSGYYDSIVLKSTDENGVKTYIFSE